MNENTTDKPPVPADKGAPKKSLAELYFEKLHGDSKLTRIPVKHLFFAESIDHSGGWESQISNAVCYRPGQQPSNLSRYYVADFIPAWQAIEWSSVRGPDSEPVTEILPIVHVRRWKRA